MGLFRKMLVQQITETLTKPPKKTISKQQLEAQQKQKLAADIRAQAWEQSKQHLKIVRDCVELVNTTTNPAVFFPRYNLMLEHLEALSGLECTGIFESSKELPSAAFLRVEAQFPAATNDFIDRSFVAVKAKADSLKTEKGRANAIQRYFAEMGKYLVYMDGESIEYLDGLREKLNLQGET